MDIVLSAGGGGSSVSQAPHVAIRGEDYYYGTGESSSLE